MNADTEKNLQKIIVVGDRVLISPKKLSSKSKSGLYLPPGYQEKEEVQTGYVVKCGPGYPIPMPADDVDDTWKNKEDHIKYIPLQVKEGDLALFLQRGATEIVYNDQKYYIVPQGSILLIERDESLFD